MPLSPTRKDAFINTSPRLAKRQPKDKGVIPPRPATIQTETAKIVSQLENEITQKDAAIAAISSRVCQLEDELRRESLIVHRKHPVAKVQHVINDDGRQTSKVGRSGSIATSLVLEAIPSTIETPDESIAKKFINVFEQPFNNLSYMQSGKFGNDLITLSKSICAFLEMEPRCLFLQSPVYVIGDIHGNLEDLHFFADNIWKLGMELTAGKFLFLGDYVDRGAHGLECIAYLFGLKLLYPRKLHLLRGNHETRDVNGWEDYYKDKCFLFQCKVSAYTIMNCIPNNRSCVS